MRLVQDQRMHPWFSEELNVAGFGLFVVCSKSVGHLVDRGSAWSPGRW